jgi:HlyD family secretion protein
MRTPTTIRIRLWPLVAIAILLVAGLAASFAVHKEEVVDVHAVNPEYRDLTASLSTNGRVTPIGGFQARSAISAQVEKIYVHVGEKVRAGQMLVRLRDPFAESRYTSAIAGLDAAKEGDQNVQQGGTAEELINFAGDLKRAQIEQTDATNRLDLLKKLQAKGDASEAEVADAERRLKEANTTLQTVQQRNQDRFRHSVAVSAAARVADAKATVETAREILANANITSAITGTVYSVPISPYDFVNVGADLVLIANLDAVQIRAFFDEPDIGQLRAGQPVDVTWDAKPGMSWRGRVEQPPLTVVPQGSRTVGECLITVDNSKGDLLPNTNVSVRVTTGRQDHALSIPREALHSEGEKHFVYRIVDGRAKRTLVEVGLVNLSYAQITGGLSTSDLVIVDTASGAPLTGGAAVKRVD